MKSSLIALAITLSVSPAFASGFRCEGDSGYRVKVYNQIDPSKGTRNPAKLIISHEDQGTLLVESSEGITKSNYVNYVEYRVVGTPALNAIEASLEVAFKEGVDVLGAGEQVEGTLILTDSAHAKSYFPLVCGRYKKGAQVQE